MKESIYIFLIFCTGLLAACNKDQSFTAWTKSNYSGTYKNIEFSENLIKEFTPGIYEEKDIPDDIKQLMYGRIEIDFRYDGGGLNSFMPLLYYGSINNNENDNAIEEPEFHLAIEIGHYNVIPLPVDYLFYTICTYRQPQYCRDTYQPVTTGVNYTYIVDKKPEGFIIQLKESDRLINVSPHAFFPDSTHMFFKNVSSYIDMNKGDSLKKVLMVGKGFAGIDKGLHEFNGLVTSLRIYKYALSETSPGYELEGIRNQHTENQQINYTARDNMYGTDKYIIIKYDFWPYKFQSGILIPNGAMQSGESEKIVNRRISDYILRESNIGYYNINLQTVDKNGNILNSTAKPFNIWVYPEE
jgi:hypothetical protein